MRLSKTIVKSRTSASSIQVCGGLLFLVLSLTFAAKEFLIIKGATRSAPSPAESCTLYASPSGSDRNSGTRASSPKTLLGAAAATQPGSVLCLLGGTYALSSRFRPPVSGQPKSWIVYKNYADAAVNIVWTGPADGSPMIEMNGRRFPSEPAYLEFRGLTLDGQGKPGDGFFCGGSHHLRFIGNRISNTGGSGIGSKTCDYLTADHNVVYHNGYIPASAGKMGQYYSWTSGISFNSNQWFDRAAGFHNIISNNIVAGEVDDSAHHTDGNGIILDLSNGTYEYGSANTPAALVLNNVVYGNGGRCIQAYVVTSFWFVNNTCYKNNLDSRLGEESSVSINDSRDGYVINNIVEAWSNTDPCYNEEKHAENIRYHRNLCVGGAKIRRVSDPAQIILANPLFVRPPRFDPEAKGQYANAVVPSELANGLALRPESPALRKGIDPGALPNLPEAIANGLKQYVYGDIEGHSRPQGGPFDLGAYQSSRAR